MPSNSRERKFCGFIACTLALNLGVMSQEPSQPIRVDVDLVLVNVSLFDRQQRPIVRFDAADLALREDGVPQQIVYFGKDELPLSLALVLDISGSVIPVLPWIKEAASTALMTLKPEDSVALFAFARTVRKVVDYTQRQDSILEGIASLRAGGGTSLNDALYYSARSLRDRQGARRRVIVMISDNDGMPVNDFSEQEAMNEAQEAGAVFYGIKVKGRSPKLNWLIPTMRIVKAFKKSGDMGKFASETGGEVISADKSGGIGTAFQELMERVSAQHYLGYISTNPRQDGERNIRVELSKEARKRMGKVKLRHRRAYIASPSP